MKAHGGMLKLSNIRPEIFEVFTITRLNRLFDIKDDEADALAAFLGEELEVRSRKLEASKAHRASDSNF